MIIVTGGAGFIGSVLVWKLNALGRRDILVVDRMGSGPKWRNLAKRRLDGLQHKDQFLGWLNQEARSLPVSRGQVEAIVHLGASSSTVETDADYLVANNINYSAALWTWCAAHKVPYIYASSAATYGDGEQGFDDAHTKVDAQVPLNPYGFSKHKFDQWALTRAAAGEAPPFWAGLRFFNVYGPQEYHKGSQASVVGPFLTQLRSTGTIKLFKSYRPDYAHGEQRRDFVYVKDCAQVMEHFLNHALAPDKLVGAGRTVASGIYNVGSGQARTWLDLASAVIKSGASPKGSKPKIDFIDMPPTLRDQYQYFTAANLSKLREEGGYRTDFTNLEDGVADYVENYLLKPDPYL